MTRHQLLRSAARPSVPAGRNWLGLVTTLVAAASLVLNIVQFAVASNERTRARHVVDGFFAVADDTTLAELLRRGQGIKAEERPLEVFMNETGRAMAEYAQAMA